MSARAAPTLPPRGSFTQATWWLSAVVTAFAIPFFLLTTPPTALVAYYREEARREAARAAGAPDSEIGEVHTLLADR